MSQVIAADAPLLDAALVADRPLMIDFWAPWCAPCRVFAPIVDEIADDYADILQVVKVDIDAEPALAERFGVRAIPLLLLMVNGEERARLNGRTTKTRLAALLDSHLG